MLEKIPALYWIILAAAVLLSGPITAFSFLLGGIEVGVGAVLVIFFFFLALYIIIVRRFG